MIKQIDSPNVQYGKWNAVLATNGNHSFVFYQNHSKIFPEPLRAWTDALKKSAETGTMFPVRLDIDITNICCNDCVMCFARELREKHKTHIALPKLLNIFEDFQKQGGASVRLTGGGDCLTHPSIVPVLNHLGNTDLKITIETNGDLLSRPKTREAVAKNIHHLRVSVNAGDNLSRALVHRPRNRNYTYDQLLSNIRTVKEIADHSGRSKDLFLGATFVALPQNYKSLQSFVADMKEIGVNWIAVRQDIHREVYSENPHILPHVKNVLAKTQKSDDFTIEGQYGVSFQPKQDFDSCWVSYVRPIILADSSLQLCCLARNDVMPAARVGVLGDSPFPIKEALTKDSDRVRLFREDVPEKCGFCIDKDNNISFSHITDLVRKGGFSFFKAKVHVSSQRMLTKDRFDIYQVTIPEEDFEEFNKGRMVSLKRIEQKAPMP